MKLAYLAAAGLFCSQVAFAASPIPLTDQQLAEVRGTGAGGAPAPPSMMQLLIDDQRNADLYTLTHTGAGVVDVWLATGQIQLIAANVLGPPPLGPR